MRSIVTSLVTVPPRSAKRRKALPEETQNAKVHRLEQRVKELESALLPFADIANTWTIQTAAMRDELVTVSNKTRSCGIKAKAFVNAETVLKKG